MSSQTVVMPQLGESVMEGVVIRWFVQEGAPVAVDTPLCEVETDKASVEIPSPMEGYVARYLVNLNDLVEVGNALVEITSERPQGAAAAEPRSSAAATPAPLLGVAAPAAVRAAAPASASINLSDPVFAAPAQVAAPAMGSPMQSGGPAQWTHLATMATAAPAAAPSPKDTGAASKAERWIPFGHPEGAKAYRYPQPTVEEGDKVEKFSRRRQMIAEHMVISQAVSPHVVTVAEVDMTELVRLRDAHKERLKSQRISLTFLAFILKATVEALGEFPAMNAVVGDGVAILKSRINLGCAVETEAGLVVPVIRDAGQYNVIGLAGALTRLAARAREGVLEPDDVTGGTFTVSNPGLKGNLYGGAIINQPQVGIVRIGEIKKRPMVIQRDGEDVIAIRHMMYVALSYDHRVVDGVTGNSFLFRIRELLEQARFQV